MGKSVAIIGGALVLGAVGYYAFRSIKGAATQSASAAVDRNVRNAVGGLKDRVTAAAGNVSDKLGATVGQVGASLLSSFSASRSTGNTPPPDFSSLAKLF